MARLEPCRDCPEQGALLAFLVKNGEGRQRGAFVRSVAPLLVLLLVAVLATFALAQPKFPALTGRVVDEANLLSGEDKRTLEAELKALEEKSTDQLVVYTTRSLQGYPIEDFGYQLGRAWKLGQKGKDNGAILIVAPNDRKVRIEVGRGLEPQLTDVMTKLIIENAILPAFRRGDFVAGIKAGVRDIRDVMLGDAEAVKQRARGAAKRTNDSGGGIAVAVLILFVLVAFAMIWAQSVQTAHPGRFTDQRRRRSGPRRGSLILGIGQLEQRFGRRRGQRRRLPPAVEATSAAAARRGAGRNIWGAAAEGDGMTLVSRSRQKRVAQAITRAEEKTSGEIVAVIAPESGSYLHVPFLWAALAALAVPFPFVFWTWWPIQHIYLLQIAVFAALVLVLMYRPIRLALVPPTVKKARRTAARWSSSWRRTCTPPSAARAC